jgi:hypothetical protein
MRDKTTVIRLAGGTLVVPGHAKSERGLLQLVSRSILNGTARVERKS